MAEAEYDLVVIGCGPAGEKGAAQAAYYGKRVAIVEKSPHPGGAGINTGTLPSKTLRETALYFSGLRQRGLYGIDYSLREGLTIRDFMFRKETVTHTHWNLITRNIERHGITLIQGEASLQDPHTVTVHRSDGQVQTLNAGVILIATGSSPYHPPDVPFDHKLIFDSDEILEMDDIPTSIAVVGGGVIGTEYACIFTALGVQVTLIDARDRLLPFVDGEMAERLRRQLEGLGLRFYFNTRVEKAELGDREVSLDLSSGERLSCEIVLYASGRQSNIKGLGLEAVGVEVGNRGLVLVNEKYQTSVPNIYAAGDVIGFPALASTSMEQARVAMVHAFDLHYKERVSPVLPLAVYTIPEIAMAGLTEEECLQKDIPYLCGRALYERNSRGQIIGDTSGLFKLIFSPADKKLLGVHIIGEMASEMVHLGAHVLAAGGSIDAFIEAVYNYPSLTDSYKYAAYDGLGAWEKWRSAQPTG